MDGGSTRPSGCRGQVQPPGAGGDKPQGVCAAWKERVNSTAALFTLWLHVSQRGRGDANLSSGQQTHESCSELAGLICSAAPRPQTPLDAAPHTQPVQKHTHTQGDLIKIKHNQVRVS